MAALCTPCLSSLAGPSVAVAATGIAHKVGLRKKRSESMSDKSYGHKIYKDLKALNDDTYVKKTRYSAFINGSSDIDEKLRVLGIENLLITGTATNVCCESSARDAMMLNYKTLMISDACSANSDREHTSSLLNFLINFGDVRTTNEIIEVLKNNCN